MIQQPVPGLPDVSHNLERDMKTQPAVNIRRSVAPEEDPTSPVRSEMSSVCVTTRPGLTLFRVTFQIS